MLIEIAVVVFVVTAAIGTTLARTGWRGERSPALLLIAHGSGAMAGILLLSLAVVPIMGRYDTGLKGMALGLFLLAAGLGVSTFITHEEDQPLRKRPVIAHGAMAIAAILLLIAGVILNR